MSASGPPPGNRRPGNPRAGVPVLASGKSPNFRPALVGRSEEFDAIRRLLEAARSGEASGLVLVGEPGIGKSALLDSARTLAEDFLCLSCRGAEAETDLAHGGLFELLTPVRHLVDQVPQGQAVALGHALGWASAVPAGPPVDRFLVAAGTLSLLAAAAAQQPVLILVDDLHWLDRESAFAVTFAARRLNSDAVALLFNSRPDAPFPELLQGIPVHEVGRLTDSEAVELCSVDVAASVVARLNTATGGNPLALLEVTRRLSPAQRVGASELPDPLPVGDLLHTVYDDAISQLPRSLRATLLLIALDPAASLSLAEGASLDEATERGVLVVDGRVPRFRHPLLRSALLRLATPSDLREAHLTIAAGVPPGSPAHVRHQAAAAMGTRDDIADALAELAARDRDRFGHAAASVELERSAALTTDPASSADRLVAAAREAFLAGDLNRTRELVDSVLDTAAAPQTRGRGYFTLGMLEQYAGSVVLAADHLTEACSTLQGAELVDALSERALVAFTLNDMSAFAACARRIATEGDFRDPGQLLRARFTGGLAGFLHGDYVSAQAQLVEVTELALAEELRDDPRSLLLMALAAGLTDTVDVALRRGMSRANEVRARGGVGMLVPLLTLTAAAHAIVGDHARAFAEAGEAADLAACLGYVGNAALAFEQLAWQNAARGFHDEARAALSESRRLLERAETVSAAAHYALTAAFCALCRGDLNEVVALLEARLVADGGLGMAGEPLGVAPLLIEAYVGLGRTEDAISLTRRLAESMPGSTPSGMTALLLRSKGLAATDPGESQTHFEEAVKAHAHFEDVFEKARTHLLFGSRLRRDGRRIDARQHLTEAEAAFNSMELTWWAEIAASELRATGARRTRATVVNAPSALTSQETRVALLVAEGKTNKEVAAALFLSPKTIERHLGNVFRKRGFRSRAELARTYAGQGD